MHRFYLQRYYRKNQSREAYHGEVVALTLCLKWVLLTLQSYQAIFLVGGFAASDYMFTRLKELFEPLGAQFCRPDSHT